MNKQKGDEYELFIRNFIRHVLNEEAHLWSHTPETILIKAGIIGSHNEHRLKRKDNKDNPLHDTGIDIIQVNVDGSVSLVQCKNGYEKGVTMANLAGFNAWMATLEHLMGYVYYTHKLSHNITSLPKNKRIEYVKKPFIEDKPIDQYKGFVVDADKLIYQNKAKDLAIEYYKEKNKGIISMPCGTGKTYTSYLIAQNYKQIIIISPLKQFAQQNLDRYVEYGYANNGLLVSSDGTRDVDVIKALIQSQESFLLSSTYDSIDVIQQLIQFMTNPIIIIDEFHNLSKSNVMDEDNDMYKIINGDNKILFMSATPRVYEIEQDDDSDFEKETFGEIIYNMSFTDAISNKYITDYKIWLPSIHEDNAELLNELTVYEIDATIKSKCMFLFSCLLNNGSRKCIIYCVDTNEMRLMMKCMQQLDEFYCLDIEMNEIVSSTTEKNRGIRLRYFAKSKKICLMFSIRILDECIDIPACDSIYITYPSQSKIRTIQRLCRCIRTDKNNKFKVGNIYIWCDEYDKILETLGGIKEYDVMFKDKIKINVGNFYGSNDIKELQKDTKLIEKYIIGTKEYKMISRKEKIEAIKKYINENKKRPSKHDKNNNIKQLGQWLNNQQHNYVTKNGLMKYQEIYDEWTHFINDDRYKKYFILIDHVLLWTQHFERSRKYFDENNTRPSAHDKDDNIKQLGRWINNQQANYAKKEHLMKNQEVYDLWTDFINNEKYKIHFNLTDRLSSWKQSYDHIKHYIDEYYKRPSAVDKDEDIRQLGRWISLQQTNYAKKEQIMKNEEIYDLWTLLITDEKYSIYFMDDISAWKKILDRIKQYIDEFNKRPSSADNEKYIRQLGQWISDQLKNYAKKNNLMKNQEIYDLWTDFINDDKYSSYFVDYISLWKKVLDQIKQYIDEYNKRPSKHDKNNDIKYLGNWISCQQTNYAKKHKLMKNEEIYELWTNFINDERYKIYFMDNVLFWKQQLDKVRKHVDDNNKKLSPTDEDDNVKHLGIWIKCNKSNYAKKQYIMKNDEVYDLWTTFINDEKYKPFI